MNQKVDIKNGSIYLSAQMAKTYFNNIKAVIILIRDKQIQIMPVQHMASGGCLLKQRNIAGDKIASAPDVFQANGLQNWDESGLTALWSSADGALIINLPTFDA